MKGRKATFQWVSIGLLLFLLAAPAWANKAAVSLEGPDSAAKGAEVTIRVNVKHSSNSLFHHVNRVQIRANDKEIARWDYSPGNLPEAADFTKEIKITVTGPVEIKAEANCNLHGSAGPGSLKISATE